MKYKRGQVYRHVKYGYIAVISEAHESCRAGSEWREQMRIAELKRGEKQPFYMSLVDARHRPKGQMTYVAEENIRLLSPEEA